MTEAAKFTFEVSMGNGTYVEAWKLLSDRHLDHLDDFRGLLAISIESEGGDSGKAIQDSSRPYKRGALASKGGPAWLDLGPLDWLDFPLPQLGAIDGVSDQGSITAAHRDRAHTQKRILSRQGPEGAPSVTVETN